MALHVGTGRGIGHQNRLPQGGVVAAGPVFLSPSAFNASEGYSTDFFLLADQPCTFSVVGGADQAQFTLGGSDLNLSPQTYSGVSSNARVVIVRATSISTGATTDQTITATVRQVAAPVNNSAATVSGSAIEGAILTATPGTWTGADQVTGQWFSNGSAVTGAISLTYTLQSTDVGYLVKYRETATNAGGLHTATQDSSATSAIKNGIIARLAARSTQAFVTDDPRWDYFLAADAYSISRVPTGSPAGDLVGYTFGTLGTATFSNATSSTLYPKPLSGAASISGSTGRIEINVPTGVQIRIKLALGAMSSLATTGVGITDGDTTNYFANGVIADTSVASGSVMGADGVVRGFADWAQDAGILVTSTTGTITLRKKNTATSIIRAVEVTYPQFSQITSGVGPYYVDNAVGDDVTGDGSIGTPWKHIPGDPAAGGLVSAFTVLPGGVVNLQGGQHHRPASYTARSNRHLQFLHAGTAGNQITYQSYGSGNAIIDGSEILPTWAAATSGDVFANPDLANIKKSTVTGVATGAYPNVICEGETYLAPAQWPAPACPYDYGRLYPGTDSFFVVPPANYAAEVIEGAADSYAAGFKACRIVSNARTGNLLTHYGSIDITGSAIVCWMVGNLITEYVIDSYDTATGTVHFHIPNASALNVSASGGWFGYAVRYHPFDIAQAGQFAYSAARTTVFGHFFGSSERSIVRLNYAATFDHDYITLSNVTLERFGITDGGAVVSTGSATVRTGLVLNNVKQRHIFNSSRNAALYLSDPMTTVSITNLDSAEMGIAVSGVFLSPTVAGSGGTVTGLRQRTSGRSTPYFGGVESNVTALDIDVSDYDDLHGNGPTIYQGANNIEVGRFYSMNRPRPVSIQSDHTSPSTRSNHIHHFVTSVRMPDPGAQWSPANFAWQGFNDETASLYELGIIGGIMSGSTGRGSPARPSTGLVMRNLFIGALGLPDLDGITFTNCLIANVGHVSSFTSAASMLAAGATAVTGCAFDTSGTEWDGTISQTMQEMITRNTGGAGYIDVSLGHSGYPWLIPANGTSFALADCILTTTSIRANHKANDTFASIVATQPGSVLSLPAVNDNALFSLWNGRVYSLATLPAGVYTLTVRQTNAHPNRTGSATRDTNFTITVA